MGKKKTLPLICIIGMPAILVIANAMTDLYITFAGSFISISAILYPLVYLLAGLIIRKASYKHALSMLLVTLISATLAFVIGWVLFDNVNANVAIYSFLSFAICGSLFIFVYDFLVKMKKDNYFTLFILIFAIILVDHMFYGALVEGTLVSSSLLVRAIYILVMPAMLAAPIFTKDYSIKKEVSKNEKTNKKK